MKKILNQSLLMLTIGISQVGCGTTSTLESVPLSPASLSLVSPDPVVEVAYRALPTQSSTVKQPAHYQHVYVESSDPSATSLKTITLRDAVYSDVLASSDLKVQKINKDRLNWLVMGAAPKQPTEIEGVGGFDVISNNNVEVNFDTDKTDILNLANLQPLVQKASRVSGTFYVVGYADETGIEQKNELLSQNRAQSVVSVLVSAGVNRTRIIDAGAGVSTLYTELALNRRAAVSFYVDE